MPEDSVMTRDDDFQWSDAVDAIASLDMFDRFDSWFGHWWSRPFWKADNPLVAFLENLTWQGHKRFALPRAGEFSGYEVEIFLRNHGIYVWGRGFDRDNVYLNVKKEQAAWAEYLMLREGIATVNTPVDPRNQAWAARHDGAPSGWGSNKRTVMDTIVSVLRPDVIASMAYRPHGRSWPSGQRKTAQRKTRKVGTPLTRRRQRRKKQQTTIQKMTKAAGARVKSNARRPARPRRPGQLH